MRRYLERLTGDPDLAGDALQEAYLRLMTRPPRETGEALRGWLFRVATNVVRDDWRRHRRALIEPERSEPPDALAILEQREQTDRVRRLLMRLSRRQRTVLLMREEGFTYAQIARALDLSHNSVGPLAARGLARLERLLREEGDAGS